jgi:REase_DpnII-MboI
MNVQELLHQRRDALRNAISNALGATMLHSSAFIARVLGEQTMRTLHPNAPLVDPNAAAYDGRYHGYPWLAAAGFALAGAAAPSDALAQEFRAGLIRLRQRTSDAQETLAGDDIGILGIADGLARLAGRADPELDAACRWSLSLIQGTRTPGAWSVRLRDLAGDLLDRRGQLQVRVDSSNKRVLATELVLRTIWPQSFQRIPPIERSDREALARLLLTSRDIPNEPEEAAIWLRCLDLMTDEASASLVPSVSDTARILANIQHGLKRWVWREKARRRNTLPSRWQIDDEYDVQSLLWTVLYPIYGPALVDEQYLPGWGQVQPRADLGITSLKLIIEVKIVRESSDFTEIEEQVAGDLGLYFKDLALFDRMVVFIYDDCDKQHPEKYEGLRSALKQREHIEEVVIVRRPGMLLDRNKRNG